MLLIIKQIIYFKEKQLFWFYHVFCLTTLSGQKFDRCLWTVSCFKLFAGHFSDSYDNLKVSFWFLFTFKVLFFLSTNWPCIFSDFEAIEYKIRGESIWQWRHGVKWIYYYLVESEIKMTYFVVAILSSQVLVCIGPSVLLRTHFEGVVAEKPLQFVTSCSLSG